MAQEDDPSYYSGFGTTAIHGGQKPHPIHGAIMPGIELSTTYAQKSPGVMADAGFDYSRAGNPTRSVLEALLAKVENGKFASCFASGCSATATVIQAFMKTGQHMISIDDVYGGTNRYMRQVSEQVAGMQVDFVDLSSAGAEARLERVVREKRTKLLWMETPTNPTLKVVDIRALTEVCRRMGVISVVDNTFATPFNQRPLDLGADLVVHSLTKYLNGHTDVVGGCVVTNSAGMNEKIRFLQKSIGAVPAPFDCYMVIRGMKTLQVRMERHAFNALRVARFLEAHPKVERVFYPHLPSHPNYTIAKQQMRTGGGMVTFLVKGGLDESRDFLENVKLMKCAESLGAVETLVEHPAIMTHASVPKEQREVLGIKDNLIRVSVGIEDIDDLMADFRRALDAIGNSKGSKL